MLGFTTNTSYTYNANQTSGSLTFKVVATYKSYNGLASAPATLNVKLQDDKTTINYSINYYCCQDETCDNTALIDTKKESGKSTTDSLTLSIDQIPLITPSANSNCTNEINKNKTGSTFTITNNGNPIDIYLKYKPKENIPSTPTTP